MSATGFRFALLATAVAVSTSCTAADAQAPRAVIETARAQIDSAVSSRDTAALAAVAARLERALVVAPGDAWLLHYRAYAMYRIVTLSPSAAQDPRSGPYLEEMDKLLAASASRMPLGETLALRSSVLGLRIGLDPASAQELGMASNSLMAQARGMAPTNPRVLYLAGMSALYTPEQWGGGMTVAKEYFARARAALAADAPAAMAPRWGRDDLAFISDRLSRGLGAP
jgi:hypothetical protein